MPVTDDDIHYAQRGDVTATRLVYADSIPICGRLAYTLTGLTSSGRTVMKRLVSKSIRQFDTWRDAAEARRWFLHQAILLTRDHHTPHSLDDDILMQGVGGPDVVAYRALIAGLRKLSAQQQEAFVLTHCEQMDVRQCAVAMDCSNQAVQTHLDQVRRSLQSLAGEHFEPLVGLVRQVHRGQQIDLPSTPDSIARKIRTGRTLRLMLRIAGWTLILAFIAALAWGAWMIYPVIKT